MCNFLVDYYDADGKYYHQEYAATGYANDDDVVMYLSQHLEKQGYTVCAVKETLSGLTYEDLVGMPQAEVDIHVRTLFIDLSHYPELFDG